VIVISEPQCWDFEHSRVNASLVHTVLLAYRESPVLFLGEPGHSARVRELLEAQAPGEVSRVEWRDLVIPRRHASGSRRLRGEWNAIRRTLSIASRGNASLVLFTSATEIGFLLLKIQLAGSRLSTPVLAVMHGVLATIVPGAPRKRWASFRGMRLVFRLPHPRRLRYVALGESILRSLKELQPAAARHTIAFEIPFSWTVNVLPPDLSFLPSPVCFGYFGVSGGRGKGFDRFFRLADELRGEFPEARFMMVGHLSTEADRMRFGAVQEDFPGAPLPQAEYARRARQVTYAVSVTDPYVYRVGASTSFLDAISSVKPGIYLRNPYLEDCFVKMGDIGYLCDTLDDVRTCMRSVLSEFPASRYARQCRNIFTMRHIFEPATISTRLHTIVEEVRRAL
jgi:hypothetical protein